MHHILLRCGWRAFFFKRLAYGLVGERVNVGQFDHALRQQAQRPAGAFVGRSRTGERDQVRLLRPIRLSLVEARSRAVGSQRRLQSLLDKAVVSVTRYFLGMAGLLSAAAPTTRKTLNPSLQL